MSHCFCFEDILRYVETGIAPADLKAHLQAGCPSCERKVDDVRNLQENITRYGGIEGEQTENGEVSRPIVDRVGHQMKRESEIRQALGALIEDHSDRFLEQVLSNPSLLSPLTVKFLCQKAKACYYNDLHQADRIVSLAETILNGLPHASDRFESVSRDVAQIELITVESTILLLKGHYREALSRYEEAERQAEEMGDQLEVANILIGKSRAYAELAEYEKAEEEAERALHLFEAYEHQEGIGRIALILARLQAEGKHAPENAIPYLEMASQVFEATERSELLATTALHLGICCEQLGRLPDAVEAYQEALALFEHEGAELEIARVKWNIGHLFITIGSAEDGLALLSEAEIEFEEQDSIADVALVNLTMAKAYLMLDQEHRAARRCIQAIQLLSDEGLEQTIREGVLYLQRALHRRAAKSEQQKILERLITTLIQHREGGGSAIQSY